LEDHEANQGDSKGAIPLFDSFIFQKGYNTLKLKYRKNKNWSHFRCIKLICKCRSGHASYTVHFIAFASNCKC